jgi:hypothetical protein
MKKGDGKTGKNKLAIHNTHRRTIHFDQNCRKI